MTKQKRYSKGMGWHGESRRHSLARRGIKTGRANYSLGTGYAKALPMFKGYTVDERLRQFRKVEFKNGVPSIKFIDFDSMEGKKLREGMKKINTAKKSNNIKTKVSVSKAFAGKNDFWLVQKEVLIDGEVISVPDSQIVEGKDKANALKKKLMRGKINTSKISYAPIPPQAVALGAGLLQQQFQRGQAPSAQQVQQLRSQQQQFLDPSASTPTMRIAESVQPSVAVKKPLLTKGWVGRGVKAEVEAGKKVVGAGKHILDTALFGLMAREGVDFSKLSLRGKRKNYTKKIPLDKLYGGNLYHLQNIMDKKVDAEKMAKSFKKQGYRARVVKRADKFVIYTQKYK